MNRFKVKEALAAVCDRTGISSRCGGWLNTLRGPHVRVLYYHDVPQTLAGAFERQLQFFSSIFTSVTPFEFEALIEGSWRPKRPGLILTFDDGLRSHAEVVAPLLEKYGWQGWFFVPPGFVNCPEHQQAEFARGHRIEWHDTEEQRVALTWQQVTELDGKHVVGSHTMTHARLCMHLNDAAVRAEVADGKRVLEDRLGHAVPAFSWVGGEEWAYSASGLRAMREAGITTAFTTNTCSIRPGSDRLLLDRTHMEAWFPLSVVKLQTSGILDVAYAPKRRRVRKLLSAFVEDAHGRRGR